MYIIVILLSCFIDGENRVRCDKVDKLEINPSKIISKTNSTYWTPFDPETKSCFIELPADLKLRVVGPCSDLPDERN